MSTKPLAPWKWGGLVSDQLKLEPHPYTSLKKEMDALREEMDELFDDFWQGAGRHRLLSEMGHAFGEVVAHLDVMEDSKGYHVTVDLPGMDQSDVDVMLEDDVLTIKGEKKRESEEKKQNFFKRERIFGSFQRTCRIPGSVDQAKIEASFDKGVLKIDLPKAAHIRRKAKQIKVKKAA
jgi:HSP20 family protein